MKVIITRGKAMPQVVSIEDSLIDLAHYDLMWDFWTRVRYAGREMDLCITGKLTGDGEPRIDYDVAVSIEGFIPDTENRQFVCKSPIIEDDYSAELRGEIRDVVVSRLLLCEYGYDGDKPTIEQLRLMSKDALRYWGESGGYANALLVSNTDIV